MLDSVKMAYQKISKRAKWTIAAIGILLTVVVVIVLYVLFSNGGLIETPIGCGSVGLISYVTIGNKSQETEFSVEDCWDHYHDIPGPRVLLLDDLSNAGWRWSHGSTWVGPDGTGSENDGGANFANETLAYNYTYVVGDGKGNGPRTVWITFLNGQSFLVSPDTDTAFMISTQHGLWVETTVMDLPPNLDDFGETAAQALVDDNEVIRNFLSNTSSDSNLAEEPMEESSVKE
jgi:hypothetical protein